MKGFIFSIESMMAVGFLLLAATTLWVTVYENTDKDIIAQKLENTKIMTLYFNEPAKENNQTNINQKCENLFYYNSFVTINTGTQTMSQKTICEGSQ